MRFRLEISAATTIEDAQIVVRTAQIRIFLESLLKQRLRFLVFFFRREAGPEPPQSFRIPWPQPEIVLQLLLRDRVVSLLLSHSAEEQIGVCVSRADAQQFLQRLLRVVKPL